MRIRLTAAAFAIVVLVSLSAPCSDVRTTLEITAADLDASHANHPAWGWWNESKYSTWSPSAESDTDLVEGRLAMAYETYIVAFTAERFPLLRSTASWTDTDSGETVHHRLTADLEVFDLALGQRFGSQGEHNITPWFGATLFNIDESRAEIGNDLRETASSELWGVVIGADAEVLINEWLAVEGRAVVRWGEGTRRARLLSDVPDPDSGQPAATDVVLTDKTDRGMYGAELGVRWLATTALQVEGGWRYRNWEYDDGPANFDGPYLRLIASF